MKKISIRKLSAADSEYDFFEAEYTVNNDLYRLPVLSEKELIWGHNTVRAAEKEGLKKFTAEFSKGIKRKILFQLLRQRGRTDSYGWFEKEKILDFMKRNSLDIEKPAVLSLYRGKVHLFPIRKNFQP